MISKKRYNELESRLKDITQQYANANKRIKEEQDQSKQLEAQVNQLKEMLRLEMSKVPNIPEASSPTSGEGESSEAKGESDAESKAIIQSLKNQLAAQDQAYKKKLKDVAKNHNFDLDQLLKRLKEKETELSDALNKVDTEESAMEEKNQIIAYQEQKIEQQDGSGQQRFALV